MPNFTDSQIEFMRQDIASNFALSKLIELTKRMLKKQGRDFDKEFAEWQKKKER
jgi:hypothetical protein